MRTRAAWESETARMADTNRRRNMWIYYTASHLANAAYQRAAFGGIRSALRIGKAQIHDHQVGGALLQAPHGFVRIERRFHLMARCFQQHLAELELLLVVFGYQDA